MRRLYLSILFVVAAAGKLYPVPSPARLSVYQHAAKQKEIVYLFAHGLRSDQAQGLELFSNHYTNRWIIQQPFVLFDFPDAHPKKGRARDKYVNLGQWQDIERMERAYTYAKKKVPECEGIILTGISRGAATCLNFAATCKKISKVRAIVVESPFDTLKTVVKHLLKRYKLKWMPFSTSMGMQIANNKFEHLDPKGLFPIDLVKFIPHDIPILLVGTPSDDVVPMKSVRAIYTALRRAGHADVYLLELPSGQHGRLIQGSSGYRYTNCVHAFYQLYDLPHDEQLATLGQEILAQCQPEVS